MAQEQRVDPNGLRNLLGIRIEPAPVPVRHAQLPLRVGCGCARNEQNQVRPLRVRDRPDVDQRHRLLHGQVPRGLKLGAKRIEQPVVWVRALRKLGARLRHGACAQERAGQRGQRFAMDHVVLPPVTQLFRRAGLLGRRS